MFIKTIKKKQVQIGRSYLQQKQLEEYPGCIKNFYELVRTTLPNFLTDK